MKSFAIRIFTLISSFIAAALLASPALAAPFTVYTPEPGTAFTNEEIVIYAELADGVEIIHHCNLHIDGTLIGPMTVLTGPGGKTSFRDASIATAGSHTVRVWCYNASGADDVYNERTISVQADNTAPVLGSITVSPSSPVAGDTLHISTTYDEGGSAVSSGIDNCRLYVGGVFYGNMNLSGGSGSTLGTASIDLPTSASGNVALRVDCLDASGNLGTRSRTVTVAAADTAPPVVSAVSPTSAVKGTNFNFTATYSDASTVTNCTLYVEHPDGSFYTGSMTRTGTNSGTASGSYIFTSSVPPGSYDVYVRCTDNAGNTGTGSTIAVVVTEPTSDTAPPIMSTILETTAVAGEALYLRGTLGDASGVTECYLFVNGSNVGETTITASDTLHSIAYTFPTAGTYNAYFRCTDGVGNTGNSGTQTITVTGSGGTDTTPPTVSAPVPNTAVQGVGRTFTVTYSDANPVTNCVLDIQQPSGLFVPYTMSRSGTNSGTATYEYTFSTSILATGYGARARCTDTSGNEGMSPTVTIVVSAPGGTDVTAPTVSIVAPLAVTRGQSYNFRVSYADASTVTRCILYIPTPSGGYLTREMSRDGGASGLATYPYTFPVSTPTGEYSIYADCTDIAGNTGTGTTGRITISGTTGVTTDVDPPVVSAITPAAAVQGVPQTYIVTFSDNGVIAGCNMHIRLGSRTLTYPMSWNARGNAGSASFTWTFFADTAPPGAYNMYATCFDTSGNTGTGGTTAVNLTAAPTGVNAYSYRLVKLACPADAGVNHPCKAVYYVDSLGTRHAFPNEKVFFTWYTSFNNILEVDAAAMSSFPLGRNVNYRPGTRMVKFTTLNKVYAVGRYGELRWVSSEELARSIYGNAWNQQIDDINDAFYGDYTFGPDITTAGVFLPNNEQTLITQIDGNYLR